MNGNPTWLEALQDDDVRKHIAYNITLVGTTKAVNAIYQNPDFAGCRTADAKQDRKAIRSAIQVCNPKNRDRFNSQKYGAAVADAMSHRLEYLVSKSIPTLNKHRNGCKMSTTKPQQPRTSMTLNNSCCNSKFTFDIKEPLLSQMQWAFQFLQWRAQHADPGAAQPELIREMRSGNSPNLLSRYEAIRRQGKILNDDDRALIVHLAYLDPRFFVEYYLHDPQSMYPLQPHHVQLLNLIPYDKRRQS